MPPVDHGPDSSHRSRDDSGASEGAFPESPPERIGSYRILEVLGEGGMGVVYEAEQAEPVRRRVALKIIKPGMDTRQVVARFEAERQALAVMSHPNIAAVHDGGATESGRPYFVMELVRGVPITEYCDMHKLSLRERLELFMPVCQAVQHAHQKGVIHRDLKPSNILVTLQDGKPVPKVIDFGIAKAIGGKLTEQTLHTVRGQMIGTPAYMSPEQAEMSGLDVDTRTDIYSLGVILYELLAGTLPFDPKDLQGYTAIVTLRDTEPPRPSTRFRSLGDRRRPIAECRHTDPTALVRRLRGDLDWIVMKAMEKDRTRRYETANGLALELTRYLRHEPVRARAPSTAYRVGKFVRRHKVGVLTGATVTLALAAAAVLATAGMVRATRAERVARSEAEAARQVSDFLVGLFEVSDPSEALGDTITAREILDRGASEITTELAGQPLTQARLMGTIGEVYASLGLYRQAVPMLRQALALREAEYGTEHEAVAEVKDELARVFHQQGEFEEAERQFDDALAIREKVHGPDHPAVARTLHGLANLYGQQARFEEADSLFRQALSIQEAALGPVHPVLAITLNDLASLYRRQRRYEEAEPLYRRALEIREEALSPEHPDVASSLNNLAVLLRRMGRPGEAEPLYRRALSVREKTLGPDHPRVAVSLNSLAILYSQQERYAEAESLYWRSLNIKERALGSEHPDVANTLNNIAILYSLQGRVADAEPLFKRALAIREQAYGPEHPRVAATLNNLGLNTREQGRYAESERYFRSALRIREAVHGPDHPAVAETLENYAKLLELSGRSREAEDLSARAAAIRARSN